MAVSLYSVLAAMVWFSLFILLAAWVQHKTGLLLFCRPTVLLLLAALTVIRVLVPIELPVTQEIRATAVYPFLRDLLREAWITVAGTPVSGARLLLVIWAMGAVVQCARLYLTMYRDVCSIRRVRPIPCQPAEQCLLEILNRDRSVRRVRLTVSPNIKSPLTSGFFNPVILLPQECGEMQAEELKSILLHELSHLKNRDMWVILFLRLFCCAMWWNPCVYLLKRDLVDALEYQCDLTATRSMAMGERIVYMQTLLDSLARFAGPKPATCTAFCGPGNQAVINRRFNLILNQEKYCRKRPAVVFAAAVFALFLASYSFVLQPASFPPSGELTGEVVITSENAYIQAVKDGTYKLILQGEERFELSVDNLDEMPCCSLRVQNYDGED